MYIQIIKISKNDNHKFRIDYIKQSSLLYYQYTTQFYCFFNYQSMVVIIVKKCNKNNFSDYNHF